MFNDQRKHDQGLIQDAVRDLETEVLNSRGAIDRAIETLTMAAELVMRDMHRFEPTYDSLIAVEGAISHVRSSIASASDLLYGAVREIERLV